MSYGSLVPGAPLADYHPAVLRNTGPGPAGRSTGLERVTNFGENRARSNGHNKYLNYNYYPRLFAPPYDQCQYHCGALVFSNNASYTQSGNKPRSIDEPGNASLRTDAAIPLHVLNMISRDVARTCRTKMREFSRGAGPTPFVDPTLITEVPEIALAPHIDKLSTLGINDEYANIVLSWTALGAAALYNFLGVVTIQNNDAPPALGGQTDPVLALNVANEAAVPYPVKDVWGADALELSHLYIIVKLIPVVGVSGLVQVAWLPYATYDQFVKDENLVFQGHHSEERGYPIYIGQVRDRLEDPASPEFIARAIGLDPTASAAMCDKAFGELPSIQVDLSSNRRVTM